MADRTMGKTDPCIYKGPVRSADGQVPYNGYLFGATECWSMPYDRFDSRARIEVWHVILEPGQPVVYSTSGHVMYMTPFPGHGHPLKQVFATRTEAIRASAARLIRLARYVYKDKPWFFHGHWRAPEIIAWALETVARETGEAQPPVRFIPIPPRPPQPVRPATGLPLLDIMEGNYG